MILVKNLKLEKCNIPRKARQAEQMCHNIISQVPDIGLRKGCHFCGALVKEMPFISRKKKERTSYMTMKLKIVL